MKVYLYRIVNKHMETVYLNGEFIPNDRATISPDDRGFLFADSVYEVVRWYGGYFFDMEGHASRLKRSLREIKIVWDKIDEFPMIAEELLLRNDLGGDCSIVYIQVTRGAAPRNHAFPDPPVKPTVYAFARRQSVDTLSAERGISIDLADDLRWGRCDIKSTALLANVMAYQAAHDRGCSEVCFRRGGLLTEGAHSNMFFVRNEIIYTHPESNSILSGITRRNVIAVATENGIDLVEEAVAADMLSYVHEAFLTNTSGEVVPVIRIGDHIIGDGKPGPVTKNIQRQFRERVQAANPIR
jgi:D-alanine transaminase